MLTFQTGLNQKDTIENRLRDYGIEALRQRRHNKGNYLMIIENPRMSFEYPILNYGVEGHMTPRQKRDDEPTWD